MEIFVKTLFLIPVLVNIFFTDKPHPRVQNRYKTNVVFNFLIGLADNKGLFSKQSFQQSVTWIT
jgi:hypothetical protein